VNLSPLTKLRQPVTSLAVTINLINAMASTPRIESRNRQGDYSSLRRGEKVLWCICLASVVCTMVIMLTADKPSREGRGR